MSPAFPEAGPVSYGGFKEDAVVEQPAAELLASLGWEVWNWQGEGQAGPGPSGRRTLKQPFLPAHLEAAVRQLNPDLPDDTVAEVVEEVTRDRTKLVRDTANQEVYALLKDGVKGEVRDASGRLRHVTARIIDWKTPTANEFLAVRQFWLHGEIYNRRCDTVLFVNGLPLVLVEFKRPAEPLRSALDDNVRDYRGAIPQLFPYNAFVVLSNGSEAKLGTAFAPWEHFFHWKRVSDEAETGSIRQETLIRGTCDPARLLDIVENFTVFEKAKGGLVKKVGKNHQVLGVNKAISVLSGVQKRPAGEAGRLGVFWHTQGSGKSLSMVFFCQKILRTVPGNWTFVIVTDRQELGEKRLDVEAALVVALDQRLEALQQLLACRVPLHHRVELHLQQRPEALGLRPLAAVVELVLQLVEVDPVQVERL